VIRQAIGKQRIGSEKRKGSAVSQEEKLRKELDELHRLHGGIAEALEEHGFVHMANKEGILAILERLDDLEQALGPSAGAPPSSSPGVQENGDDRYDSCEAVRRSAVRLDKLLKLDAPSAIVSDEFTILSDRFARWRRQNATQVAAGRETPDGRTQPGAPEQANAVPAGSDPSP